jgi:hypothetical protein
MTVPIIPTLPAAPLPGDTQEQHDAKAYPFVAALNAFGQAINEFGQIINDDLTVETDLGIGGSGDSRTITSSTGAAANLPISSASSAGLMSTARTSKLDSLPDNAALNLLFNARELSANKRTSMSAPDNTTYPTTLAVASAIAAVSSGETPRGAWNASTNTPGLASSVGTAGWYYEVSVAGTTNLNGENAWQVGDKAVFNGSSWSRIPANAVRSVDGRTGAVIFNYDNVSALSAAVATLPVGATVSTKGAVTAGDGGYGIFDIVASTASPVDGYSVIGSGPYAVLRLPYNVAQFGADRTGASSSNLAFNRAAAAAAAVGVTVFIQPGSYAISAATAAANWVVEDGAYISGLPDINPGPGGGIINDTSRLTGKILHYQNIAGESGIRIGATSPWLEKTIRPYTESISELSVISPTGQIALVGASRTSDDLVSNFACIGINGYAINDNTANKEPAWASYLEVRRSAGAGAAYNVEMDLINKGSTFSLDPFTPLGNDTEQAVNCWITNGGGDVSWAGIPASCGIALHPNPSTWRRGIVFRSGCLDGVTNEMITGVNGYKISWYSSEAVENSLIDHRRISQKTDINTALGCEWDLKKQRGGGAQTVSLDGIYSIKGYGCTGSGNDYLGSNIRTLQRGNFSGGNALFSVDIVAASGGGVNSEVTLNGLGARTFAPNPDNDIRLGNPTFRWSVVYSATASINTSDERTKTEISLIDDKLLDAWRDVNWCSYKFIEAVEKKGESARIHIGVIAQNVVNVFESHGLNAGDYGLLCYDEWDESDYIDADGELKTMPGGNRYGIRYSEALALECALMRRELNKLLSNNS